MIAFLTSRLGRYAIAALAIMVISMAIYARGRHDGKSSEQAAESKRLQHAKAEVSKREAKAEKITQKVSENLASERVRIEYRTRTITQEIQREAPRIDAGCVVPPDFVRLYNDAARPALPKPAG